MEDFLEREYIELCHKFNEKVVWTKGAADWNGAHASSLREANALTKPRDKKLAKQIRDNIEESLKTGSERELTAVKLKVVLWAAKKEAIDDFINVEASTNHSKDIIINWALSEGFEVLLDRYDSFWDHSGPIVIKSAVEYDNLDSKFNYKLIKLMVPKIQ